MANIAILGAGLLGRLVSLCYANHNVNLFDPKPLMANDHTGMMAAAMLAPTAESVVASERLTQLGEQSLALWPKFLSAFGWQSLFEQRGSVVLAHRADEGALRNFLNHIKPCQQDYIKHLSQPALNDLESEITFSSGHRLFLAGEAHIDNQELYRLASAYIRKNITFVNQAVSIDDDILDSFDLVIDCRGLGAKRQTHSKLRGVRGEVIRVHAPDVSITRPVRLMHPRYPIYIVPKPNNEYVIGATEIESESSSAITVRSTLELLSAAYSVHKSFSEATILSINTGLRPAYIDNEPSISIENKVIQINGLYRHGFMISPAIIAQLSKLIQNRFDLSMQTELVETFSLSESSFLLEDEVYEN